MLSFFRSLFCITLVLTFRAVCIAEPPTTPEFPRSIEVTFFHRGYSVHEDDDGWLGNGVDLYMAWVVLGKTPFGGTTPVMSGLKNNNGPGGGKGHPSNVKAFSVVIPESEVVDVCLFMIESDETTRQIKKAFAKGEFPVFSDGSSTVQMTVSVGKGEGKDKAKLDAILSVISGVKALVTGSNTDDDYGNWVFRLENDDGVIKTSIVKEAGVEQLGAGCKVVPPLPKLLPDGKKRFLFHLGYKDDDNAISTGFDAVAKSYIPPTQKKK